MRDVVSEDWHHIHSLWKRECIKWGIYLVWNQMKKDIVFYR